MRNDNTETQHKSFPHKPSAPAATPLEQEIAKMLSWRIDTNRFRVAITPSALLDESCLVGVYAIHGGDHFSVAVKCSELLQGCGLRIACPPERTTDYVTQFTVSK
jgi:hypothetical protein